MVTTRIALAGSAALLASMWQVHADAQGASAQDWYVGFSSDTTHVEVYRGLGWEAGADETGLSLRGGLRIKKRFAVEFAAQQADDLKWTEYFTSVVGQPGIYDATATFDVRALEVSAVGIVPFAGIFEGIFRGGLAYYDVSGRQELDDPFAGTTLSRSISEQDFGALLSLGVAVYATPRWRIRAEYQFFDIDEDFLAVAYSDGASVDTVAIGVDYRLGGSER